MYSEHIFLLPISFYYRNYAKDKTTFMREVAQSLNEDDNWQSVDNPRYRADENQKMILRDYNTANFFYYPVLDIIYGNNAKNVDDELVLTYRHIIGEQNAKLILKVSDDEWYQLEIAEVQFRVYFLSAGLLSIKLINRQYSQIEAIDRINRFARKIRAPYFNVKSMPAQPMQALLKDIKGVDLADSIQIKIDDEIYAEERYLKEPNLHISDLFMSFFNDDFACIESDKQESQEFLIYPVQKEDMFYICNYAHVDMISELQSLSFSDVKEKYPSLFSSNRKLFDDQMNKGLVHLLSSNSIINITDSFDNYSYRKTNSSYQEIVKLVLVQRISIFKFQNRFAFVGYSIYKKSDASSFDIESIYSELMMFLSKVYYPEVSFDAYGTKIYKTLQGHGNMDKQVSDLKAYFSEILDYEKLEREKKTNFLLTILAVMGGVLTIPSFITGFYGMNVFLPSFDENIGLISAAVSVATSQVVIWSVLISILLGLLISAFFLRKEKNIVYSLIAIFVLIVILLIRVLI